MVTTAISMYVSLHPENSAALGQVTRVYFKLGGVQYVPGTVQKMTA
jgi:hypothetical protein